MPLYNIHGRDASGDRIITVSAPNYGAAVDGILENYPGIQVLGSERIQEFQDTSTQQEEEEEAPTES